MHTRAFLVLGLLATFATAGCLDNGHDHDEFTDLQGQTVSLDQFTQTLEDRIAALESARAGLESDLAAAEDRIDALEMPRAKLVIQNNGSFAGGSSHVIAFDATDRPSGDQYSTATHPDFFTAHDLLEAWQDAGHGTYNATESAFGFFLDDLNGDDLGADPDWYWEMRLDGVTATVGMSDAQVGDWTVVSFHPVEYIPPASA